jgi:hypothetical protein
MHRVIHLIITTESLPTVYNHYLFINITGGRFIKELQSAAKVERIELQKDRDIYEQYAGFYGRYAHIAGDFPNRLHAVYLLLRLVSSHATDFYVLFPVP